MAVVGADESAAVAVPELERDEVRRQVEIRPILAGRTRVELNADQVLAVLAWARALDGWNEDRLPPLSVYPAAPAAG